MWYEVLWNWKVPVPKDEKWSCLEGIPLDKKNKIFMLFYILGSVALTIPSFGHPLWKCWLLRVSRYNIKLCLMEVILLHCSKYSLHIISLAYWVGMFKSPVCYYCVNLISIITLTSLLSVQHSPSELMICKPTHFLLEKSHVAAGEDIVKKKKKEKLHKTSFKALPWNIIHAEIKAKRRERLNQDKFNSGYSIPTHWLTYNNTNPTGNFISWLLWKPPWIKKKQKQKNKQNRKP